MVTNCMRVVLMKKEMAVVNGLYRDWLVALGVKAGVFHACGQKIAHAESVEVKIRVVKKKIFMVA